MDVNLKTIEDSSRNLQHCPPCTCGPVPSCGVEDPFSKLQPPPLDQSNEVFVDDSLTFFEVGDSGQRS